VKDKKSPVISVMRWALPAAACFAIVFAGIKMMPNISDTKNPADSDQNEQIASPIIEEKSADDIKDKIGIAMNVPEDASEVSYYIIDGEIGEISFQYGGHSYYIRASRQDGDFSGLFGTAVPKLNLPLPIGISFYTFQTMSYTIDVYRGDAKMQKNILTFGTYVSFFPQLIAGPIVRYQDIADQLDSRIHSFDKFGEGARRFVTGLAKKVLLANNIGLLWNTISETNTSELSTLGAWLGVIAYGFQIYFDFSGYSDMAIGLGKMFGFEFLENFNYPYISKSVTEFWRRWHISLGTWFRDYVYIPLDGNRKGLKVQLRNIAIVWLLTGFWHGASWNFVLWGLYYGVILVFEKLFLLKILKKAPSFIGNIYAMLIVTLGWVLFAFDDLKVGGAYFKVMLGSGAGVVNGAAMYQLLSYLPLILICIIASTPVMKNIYGKLKAMSKGSSILAADIIRTLVLTGLSAAYLISGSYNSFLYFRF
jgi:alginate O-acetyltransferase complex protein AlgI